VDRVLAPFSGMTAGCLSINGDHPGWDDGELCDPGDEATLKGLGVRGWRNVAEMIMRGGIPSVKGRKPAQEFSFCRPRGDLDEAIGPARTASRHNSSTSGSGYFHLPALAGIRQVVEMRKKHHALTSAPQSPHRPSIASSTKRSEDHDRFSTPALCHELLHRLPCSIPRIRLTGSPHS